MNLSDYAPFMLHAIRLAEKGRWTACPNPTVGAVLVRNNEIVAEGWHHAAGQPHAEVECLRDAAAKGVNPAECSLLVTLEPCNHYGKTPPCSEAVIAAGIKHVIIGMRDPNPVAGGGLERLQAAGVHTEAGLCARECEDLTADFRCWQKKRPYVILKMASTLDGRIATRTGHSQWISAPESRASVHELRKNAARCGAAVFIGGGTFRADNPSLTVRTEGYTGVQPAACVVSSRLPAPDADYKLLRERPLDTIFLSSPAAAASSTAAALRKNGVRVIALEQMLQKTSFLPVFHQLYEEYGFHYIICEGGGKLALSLLNEGLVDEFRLHLAPLILGDNEAKPLFDGLSPMTLDEGLGMRITDTKYCGQDIHLTLRPQA